MSHHGKLREDNSCENCGHFVDKRFCPECGQENVETRQRFHYLFTHFVQDFIHYDSRFWKTILFLLTRPAKLTTEYLAGKRKSYMLPVTLYLFISFITFFLPAILPEKDSKEIKKKEDTTNNINIQIGNKQFNRSLSNKNMNEHENTSESIFERQGNYEEMEVDSQFEKLLKKFDWEKWKERIKHDFPKAIFLYMPVFAFWLWLIHSKKKWYYFDHGIYTLHYFSFILLSCLLYFVITWALSFFQFTSKIVNGILPTLMVAYFIYYFFHSHRLVYQENKARSRIKCSFLFIINSFCMSIFLLFYVFAEVYITDAELFKELLIVIREI